MIDPDAAAQREARRSFLHKLGIVGVALLGYAGLIALGNYKHGYAKHQKEVWQLTAERLDWFATTATAIAPEVPREAPPASDKVIAAQAFRLPSDSELLHLIAGNFRRAGRKVSTTAHLIDAIDTRQELVAAVEQLADAYIWRETIHQIERVQESPATQGDRLLDLIAGREAYTRARVASLHALIEATATQLERSQTQPPLLQKIFDEKHPLHVLYELSWFMLLALAVLATAWLLMILFTVLPFTSSEGYWTKKITDILERTVPAVVAAGAALPMAAAALIAATAFVGTSLAITPGGSARSTTIDQLPPTACPCPPEVPAPPKNDDVSRILAAISNAKSTLLQTVQRNARALHEHLDRADEAQREIRAASQAAAGSAAAAAGWARLSERQANLAVQQTTDVPTIAMHATTLVDRVGEPPSGTTIAKQVASIEDDLTADEKKVKDAHTTVQGEYDQEHGIRRASLAQATLVDPRGLFWRTFGRTQFKIGPAVVHQMAAALGVALAADGKSLVTQPAPSSEQLAKERLITRLIAVEEEEEKNSRNFLKMIHEGTPAITNEYDRQLLHLCALSRD